MLFAVLAACVMVCLILIELILIKIQVVTNLPAKVQRRSITHIHDVEMKWLLQMNGDLEDVSHCRTWYDRSFLICQSDSPLGYCYFFFLCADPSNVVSEVFYETIIKFLILDQQCKGFQTKVSLNINRVMHQK